jgi:Holliday junction resolvase RusA-like endonuclease
MTNFTIPLIPVTKKNSSRILINKRTGSPFIAPSRNYEQYEKETAYYIHPVKPIDYPCNVKCVFYMPTARRVDLNNLLSAACDVLVKHGALADDNSDIVVSHDGSRVVKGDLNPRTEIEITAVGDGE